MKLDPGMHIGLHLVFFGKTGVTQGRFNLLYPAKNSKQELLANSTKTTQDFTLTLLWSRRTNSQRKIRQNQNLDLEGPGRLDRPP
jgi:hypothetical protein